MVSSNYKSNSMMGLIGLHISERCSGFTLVIGDVATGPYMNYGVNTFGFASDGQIFTTLQP